MVEPHWISAEPDDEIPSKVTLSMTQIGRKSITSIRCFKDKKYKAQGMVSRILIY